MITAHGVPAEFAAHGEAKRASADADGAIGAFEQQGERAAGRRAPNNGDACQAAGRAQLRAAEGSGDGDGSGYGYGYREGQKADIGGSAKISTRTAGALPR